jgi:hypothetical protein
MYRIEKEENYVIYVFDEINLKIKVVDDIPLKNVYINYKGYNPLFTMLLGEFSADCEMDDIDFDVKSEVSGKNNTLYSVVKKEVLEIFIKDIYFFIMENKVEHMLDEDDKIIWDF